MHRLIAPLVLLLAAWTALPAAAAGTQACRDDAQKLCQGVQPGGGRVVDCLQQHQAELSGACQAALPVMARCGAELRKLCGESGSPQAARSCLREQHGKLSAECRSLAGGR